MTVPAPALVAVYWSIVFERIHPTADTVRTDDLIAYNCANYDEIAAVQPTQAPCESSGESSTMVHVREPHPRIF